MALNLGDITFGLGVEEKGLDKSLRKLQAFSKEIDRVAKSQTDGAKAVASAMGRQEAAVRSNLQKVLALKAALRATGADRSELLATTNAFKSLTTAMTKGRLTSVQFARAQANFNARIGKSKRVLRGLQTGTAEATSKGAKFTKVMRNLESASVLAIGPLSGVGARIRSLGTITSRSTLAIAGLLAGITGILVVVAKLSSAAIKANISLERASASLQTLTGSSVLAKRELGFIITTARELKVSIAGAAEQYAKLAAATIGSNIASETTRKLFTGVSKAAVSLRLRGEQVAGVFKALEQIISKGTVQAEELRGQFAERIPGGFRIAALAMGVTTEALNEMLKKGEVLAEDLIPKLADKLNELFGASAVAAAGTLQAAIDDLGNAALLFSKRLDEVLKIGNTFKGLVGSLANTIDFLNENLETAIALVGALGGAFLGLLAPAIFTGIINLVNLFAKLTKIILALNFAALLNPAFALANILLRVGLVAGGAAIGFLVLRDAVNDAKESFTKLSREVDTFLRLDPSGAQAKETAQAFVGEVEKAILTTRSRIEDLKKSLKTAAFLQAGILGPLSAFIISIISSDAEGELAGLNAEMGDLLDRLARLNAIASAPITVFETLSKEGRRASGKIKDLGTELENLRLQQEAIGAGGGGDAIRNLQDLAKAGELLKGITKPEDFRILSAALQEMGFTGSNTAIALGKLITALRLGGDEVSDFTKKADRTEDVLKKANAQIDAMRTKAEALKGGFDSFLKFEKELARSTAIKKFQENLDSANFSTAEATDLMNQFIAAFDALDREQGTFDRLKSTAEDIADAFNRAFDRIGASITDAFLKGEQAAVTFRNIINAIISEIIQSFVKLAIVQPLQAAVTAAFTSSASAKGNVFSNGRIKAFAKGGLINKPILFPMANGLGLAGEDGPEAVLPLKRLSGGDLGVKAEVGGGGGTIINIINNAGTEITTEKRTGSSGKEEIDVFIDRSVANQIRRGDGATVRALTETFGLLPSPLRGR